MVQQASLENLRRAFDRAVYGAEHRAWIIGLLGMRNQDGTTTISVPNRVGWTYVSVGPAGNQVVSIARNDGHVPLRAQLPVRMKRESDGALVIYGVYNAGGAADVSTGGDLHTTFGVLMHHHRLGSDLQYEHQALLFDQGRAFGYDTAFQVYINSFRYQRKSDGVWDTWEGGTIDVAAYKPATSGHWAWVLIGVDPATNTAVAVAGTSKPYAQALDIAELDNIAFGDYIPCVGIRLRNDATTVSNTASYLQDAHKWFGETHIGYSDLDASGVSYNDTIYYGINGWTVGGHKLNVGEVGIFSIVSGAVTLPNTSTIGLLDVRGEGNADDTLATISGGKIGDVLILHTSDPTTYGDITVTNSDNINIAAPYVIDDEDKILVLIYTVNGWNLPSAVGQRPNLSSAVTLLLSSDTLDITGNNAGLIYVRSESAGNPDTLETILGGKEGDIIVLLYYGSGEYITINDDDNIRVPTTNLVLNHARESISLVNVNNGWNVVGLDTRLEAATVTVANCLTAYIDITERQKIDNIHGNFYEIVSAETLASGDNIVAVSGIGKLVIAVIAGTDLSGSITVTGTSVNRNTGAETSADTDTIVVDAVTTDASTTDANSNKVWDFTGAYITSKWFKGSVTLSTTDLDLSDVDIYGVAFEQLNDDPTAIVTTIDCTMECNNSAGWADLYFYALEVTGSKCDIEVVADMHITAAESAADKYYRLRRGGLNLPIDGSTNGGWAELALGPFNQRYWEDITLKVWFTSEVDLNLLTP